MVDTFSAYLPANILGLVLISLVFLLAYLFIFQLKKTEYILYALLVWFPLESVILMYAPVSYYAYVKYIPELLMYGLLFFAWAFYFQKKKKIYPRQPLNKYFLAFLTVSAAALLLNWYSPIIWLAGLRQVLRFVAVFFIILFLDYPREKLKKIILFGLFMIVVEAVLGLAQYFAGGAVDKFIFPSETVSLGGAIVGGAEYFWTPGTRVFATMGRYERLGSFLVMGILLLFPYFYQLKTKQQKRWFTALMSLLFIALALTLSRASWIACFVGLLIIGWFVKKDKRVIFGLGIFLGFILIYLTGFALVRSNLAAITEKPNQSFAERMFESVSVKAWQNSYETYGRFYFIVETPRLVVASAPFFGVGPGRYGGGVASAFLNTDVYDETGIAFGIEDVYGQIDNNWFSIWGETGTLGLIFFMMIFVALIRMSLELIKKTPDKEIKLFTEGFVGVVAAVMIVGFFGPYFELRPLMFYFWLFSGIVTLLWMRERGKGNFLL